jgi:hypothetical protein
MISTAAPMFDLPKPTPDQLGKTQSFVDPTEVEKLLEASPTIQKGANFISTVGKPKYSFP